MAAVRANAEPKTTLTSLRHSYVIFECDKKIFKKKNFKKLGFEPLTSRLLAQMRDNTRHYVIY